MCGIIFWKLGIKQMQWGQSAEACMPRTRASNAAAGLEMPWVEQGFTEVATWL